MNIQRQMEKAIEAHQQNQLTRAQTLYQQIIAEAPHFAEAHHLLGVVMSQQGQQEAAAGHIRRAIQLDGRNPSYYNNLGEVYRRQDRPDKAGRYYTLALELNPRFAQAHYNLANVLKTMGQLAKAIDHYQQAIQADNRYVAAHYNLGNSYLEIGHFRSAAESYQQLLQLAPNHFQAHNNLGAALQELGDMTGAIAHFEQATQLKPDFVDAQRNWGQALEKQGKVAEARYHYQLVLNHSPENALFRLHAESICSPIPAGNEAIDTYRSQLLKTLTHYLADPPLQLGDRPYGEPPSLTLYQGREERGLKEAWAKLFAHLPQFRPEHHSGRPHIGFVVTHGHEGVFLKGMRSLLNNLPANRFRLTVVCSQQAGEQILRPAIQNPDIAYLPLANNFAQVVEQIRQARFDLLHYWEVGTDVTNYFLPFFGLAHVQCASWGWPVTSGIPQMDYHLSCRWLETAEADSHYSEKLIRLNHLPTYYYRPPIPEQPKNRSHFGLGAREHLYFCQQNLRKVHPDFDPLVAGILEGDPAGRVLFIEDAQPCITDLLRQRFQTIMPHLLPRITFLPRLSEADYLSLTVQADVILDTLHYGGGANTIYDAMAAGTPVVTLPTPFQRGRWACAVYERLGIEGGVANDPAGYIQTALHLANDKNSRQLISQAIKSQSPLLFHDLQPVQELADFLEEMTNGKL